MSGYFKAAQLYCLVSKGSVKRQLSDVMTELLAVSCSIKTVSKHSASNKKSCLFCWRSQDSLSLIAICCIRKSPRLFYHTPIDMSQWLEAKLQSSSHIWWMFLFCNSGSLGQGFSFDASVPWFHRFTHCREFCKMRQGSGWMWLRFGDFDWPQTSTHLLVYLIIFNGGQWCLSDINVIMFDAQISRFDNLSHAVAFVEHFIRFFSARALFQCTTVTVHCFIVRSFHGDCFFGGLSNASVASCAFHWPDCQHWQCWEHWSKWHRHHWHWPQRQRHWDCWSWVPVLASMPLLAVLEPVPALVTIVRSTDQHCFQSWCVPRHCLRRQCRPHCSAVLVYFIAPRCAGRTEDSFISTNATACFLGQRSPAQGFCIAGVVSLEDLGAHCESLSHIGNQWINGTEVHEVGALVNEPAAGRLLLSRSCPHCFRGAAGSFCFGAASWCMAGDSRRSSLHCRLSQPAVMFASHWWSLA